MACRFCGGGDQWIKTVRDGEGQTFLSCDPCYAANRDDLVIVPGMATVAGRCDGCGRYFNPRDLSDLRPGARKGAYGGKCKECSDVR